MVLLVLCLIWAAALLPPFIRSRLEGHPVDSVGRFRRHLRVLESTSPAASSLANEPALTWGPWNHRMPKAWLDEAKRLRRLRRRRQTVQILISLAVTTFVVGLIPQLRIVLAVHVLVDLMLVAYVGLLVRMRLLEAEREMAHDFAMAAAVEPAVAEAPTSSDARQATV